MIETISHEAVVRTIEKDRVSVTILQSSACSGCAARQMCNSAESKEKDVDVYTSDAASFKVGQRVLLEGRISDGRYAAMIAYGLPLLFLLPTLFLSIYLSGSEVLGAVWALLTVAFYYLFVYFFLRRRLQKRFSFHIRPLYEV
ncbi:MAG: SoxR reducing system RseC family protein [Bacteroidales bacterium]|nr:SoxR reducing system RseC family protein [Bacteroidales bacterium]